MSISKLKQMSAIVLQGLNHLCWPSFCVTCGKSICESKDSLCTNCFNELLVATAGGYCPGCGCDVSSYAVINNKCPMCLSAEFHFDGIARSGVYSDSLRKMILAFKNGRTELADIFAFLANSALHGSSFYNSIDLFVPVPLHWSRRLTRGYNQSHLLSRKLKHTSAGVSTDLVRVRRTPQQTIMTSHKKRASNVAGAFAVRKGHPFTSCNICLVDDIKTSGATLNECAKTLKQAGASKVFALVLAVAGQHTK